MINGQVSYQIWLKLPKEIRDKLIVLFHVPRSGQSVVDYSAQGNKVISDGYTPVDIEAITLEKMQALMDTDSTDFYGLFEEIILNIDAVMQPKVAVVELLEIVDNKVVDMEVGGFVQGTYPTLSKPPFCDTCASKGVRHLKTCPKAKKHGGQTSKE